MNRTSVLGVEPSISALAERDACEQPRALTVARVDEGVDESSFIGAEPAIGRNVSGARVETDPERALLAKEARGEL